MPSSHLSSTADRDATRVMTDPLLRVAGFTTSVFDRVRDPSIDPDSIDKPSETKSPYPDTRKREGYRLVKSAAAVPIGLDIMSRPFGEPVMLKVAAAFEAATGHRRPPPDFGPL